MLPYRACFEDNVWLGFRVSDLDISGSLFGCFSDRIHLTHAKKPLLHWKSDSTSLVDDKALDLLLLFLTVSARCLTKSFFKHVS